VTDDKISAEAEAMRARYKRRESLPAGRYSPFTPDALLMGQDLERHMVATFKAAAVDVAGASVLEVGCGTGTKLAQLIKLGFDPAKLTGIELLDDHLAEARRTLPSTVTLKAGDACTMDVGASAFDIVMQCTVFSSILDDGVQEALARRMWSLVKPGGAVLWYDFTYNNPSNPDVRGVPLSRIRALFPEGRLSYRRATLAPPLGRIVAPISTSLYGMFNAIPFLRTHVVCWIQKP
jgi:SAM-dependent methyltransferase